MMRWGERSSLEDGKRLAREAAGKVAGSAMESLRRHVKMARVLAGYLPFIDSIEKRCGKGRMEADGS